MKPMLRFSIAVVTVGICFLMFCGQTRKDVVAAQAGKPVMMYRFYTGKDGLSQNMRKQIPTVTTAMENLSIGFMECS